MIKLHLKSDGSPVYVRVSRILAIGDKSISGPVNVDVRESREQVACAVALYNATHGSAK